MKIILDTFLTGFYYALFPLCGVGLFFTMAIFFYIWQKSANMLRSLVHAEPSYKEPQSIILVIPYVFSIVFWFGVAAAIIPDLQCILFPYGNKAYDLFMEWKSFYYSFWLLTILGFIIFALPIVLCSYLTYDYFNERINRLQANKEQLFKCLLIDALQNSSMLLSISISLFIAPIVYLIVFGILTPILQFIVEICNKILYQFFT